MPWLTLGADAYVKGKDHVPQTSADSYLPLWDEAADGMFLAYGVDLDIGFTLGQRWRTGALQSIGRSWVLEDGDRHRYEWDVRWSTKPYLAFVVVPEALYLHLAGLFAAPIPDSEESAEVAALSWGDDNAGGVGFRNLSVKLQLHQDVEGHRHLRQYDAYVQLTDIFDLFEGSGGFGDMMEYGLLAIGLRVHFRL